MSISYHIYGCRSNIEDTATLLGIDNIHKDEHPSGDPFSIAKQTWLSPTDSTHKCVLEDDVEICDGFKEICEKMVSRYPLAIFSLFPLQFLKRNPRTDKLISKDPYIRASNISACALIIPVQYIEDIFSQPERDVEALVMNYVVANKIDFYTTLPAIVQHIGLTSTIPTEGAYHGNVQTDYFLKDVSGYDF